MSSFHQSLLPVIFRYQHCARISAGRRRRSHSVLCRSLEGEDQCLRGCGERELTETDLGLMAAFCSWLYPFTRSEIYHKTGFPRSGSSWWPKEALEAWQSPAPGLSLPCPGAHGLRAAGGIPGAGVPTSESTWQWAAIPAPSLACLLPVCFAEALSHRSSSCLSPA